MYYNGGSVVLKRGLVVGDTMQNVMGMLLLMCTQNLVHVFVDVLRGLNLGEEK